MPQRRSREIHLASRPRGVPTPENFRLVEVDVPAPREGQLLVRNLWMSVDPYMRGRMNDVPSYVPPFQLDAPLDGGAVAEVLESNAVGFAPGDLVVAFAGGWRELFVASAKVFTRLEPPVVEPLSHYLGALGMPGLTAYVGLLDLGRPRPGETVFVSAAAGAVGGLVGQLAKRAGCRAIGSAGGPAKVEHVVKELGFDGAFDYRAEPARKALRRLAPDGVDVYFDNVGGEQLEAALGSMRRGGRIVMCGAISVYNATAPEPGPRNLFQMIGRRLTMTGFIVMDHWDRMPALQRDVAPALREGAIRAPETVIEGLENAPAAFLALLEGKNVGKMVVRIAGR